MPAVKIMTVKLLERGYCALKYNLTRIPPGLMCVPHSNGHEQLETVNSFTGIK